MRQGMFAVAVLAAILYLRFQASLLTSPERDADAELSEAPRAEDMAAALQAQCKIFSQPYVGANILHRLRNL